MIILTRQEAERVLGRSPEVSHAALEPYPLKDGTYLLPDAVLVDPAHADVKDFLSSKYSRGDPDPRLLWDFGTLEEPNQAEIDAYNAARLDWHDGNQRTEAAQAMRIPSGKTDQKIFFVALDTALTTRVTGLSTWTVYRSRNGGTATAYTTPTVTEIDATNMPGVYALTIDEDTTIASTSDSEEYAVHITATGMAPVTRTIELYRYAVTSGTTLTTADVTAIKAKTDQLTFGTANRVNAQTYGMEADVITSSALATSAVTEINTGIATSAALATVDTNVSTVLTRIGTPTNLGGGATLSFNLSDIEAQTDDIGAAGAGLTALASAASITTLTGYVDTEVASILAAVDTEVGAIKTKTDQLAFTTANRVDCQVYGMQADTITASALATTATGEIADAVWDEDAGAHLTIGTFGQYLDTLYDNSSSGFIAGAVWNQLTSSYTTAGTFGKAIGSLTFTVAGQVDSNIQSVNEVTVTGAGTGGSPWGP